MKNINLSIIIPVYNTANYLIECLDSILSLNIPNYEVIIINDGSIDNSEEIIIEYQEIYPQISYYYQVNKGQGAARNFGLDKAVGEYIYFMDSDDKINSDAFINVYNQLNNQNLDAIFFDGKSFYDEEFQNDNEDDYELPQYVRSRSYGDFENGNELMVQLVQNHEFYVQPCLYIFRRSVLEMREVKYPEGIKHEDEYFSTILMLQIGRCKHINLEVFLRRIRKNSTMTDHSYQGRSDDLARVSEMLNVYMEKYGFVNEMNKFALLKRLEEIYRAGLDYYLKSSKNKERKDSFHRLNKIARKYRYYSIKTFIVRIFGTNKIMYNKFFYLKDKIYKIYKKEIYLNNSYFL